MSTAPAELPPIPDNIARIAGPLLLGYLFNWGLFGALSVQLYNYHVTFPEDSRLSKAVVYSIYILELTQTLIMTRDCFTSYAAGFGNLLALDDAQTEWLAAPIFIGIISCSVQIYYGYRVFVLSRSRILFGVIAAVALFQGSSAIAQGVQAKHIGNFHQLADKAFVSCSLWLAGSAACDVIITVSMVYLLLRRHTTVSTTHTIVVRLVHLVVETGVLTATAATIDLILFLSFPGDSFHAAVAFSLAKLYSNSLMVLFNNRAQLQRARANGSHQVSLTKSSTSRGAPTASMNVAIPGNGIHVQQTTFIDTDDIPMEDRGTKKPSNWAMNDV